MRKLLIFVLLLSSYSVVIGAKEKDRWESETPQQQKELVEKKTGPEIYLHVINKSGGEAKLTMEEWTETGKDKTAYPLEDAVIPVDGDVWITLTLQDTQKAIHFLELEPAADGLWRHAYDVKIDTSKTDKVHIVLEKEFYRSVWGYPEDQIVIKILEDEGEGS